MKTESQGKAVCRSVVNRLDEVKQEIAKHQQMLEELKKEERAIKTQLQDDKPQEVEQNAM